MPRSGQEREPPGREARPGDDGRHADDERGAGRRQRVEVDEALEVPEARRQRRQVHGERVVAAAVHRQRVDADAGEAALDDPSRSDDIAAAVIEARDIEDGTTFTRKELLDQLGVMFLAGHETTASALIWAFLIIALQPDVLVKGADWDLDKIIGRDTVEARGGKVVRVPIEAGWSTTAIVNNVAALKTQP